MSEQLRPTPETDKCAKNIDQENFAGCWRDDFEEYAWVPADFSRGIERQRDEAIDQRDKLAEELRYIALEEDSNTIWRMQYVAREALASLKGGSDE
jgi:hypothetical protein